MRKTNINCNQISGGGVSVGSSKANDEPSSQLTTNATPAGKPEATSTGKNTGNSEKAAATAKANGADKPGSAAKTETAPKPKTIQLPIDEYLPFSTKRFCTADTVVSSGDVLWSFAYVDKDGSIIKYVSIPRPGQMVIPKAPEGAQNLKLIIANGTGGFDTFRTSPIC